MNCNKFYDMNQLNPPVCTGVKQIDYVDFLIDVPELLFLVEPSRKLPSSDMVSTQEVNQACHQLASAYP